MFYLDVSDSHKIIKHAAMIDLNNGVWLLAIKAIVDEISHGEYSHGIDRLGSYRSYWFRVNQWWAEVKVRGSEDVSDLEDAFVKIDGKSCFMIFRTPDYEKCKVIAEYTAPNE